MRLVLIFLLFLTTAAHAKTLRAQRHWGGADFGFSCDLVRANRAWIKSMSADTRASLARQFNITPKQKRQAVACLKGRD